MTYPTKHEVYPDGDGEHVSAAPRGSRVEIPHTKGPGELSVLVRVHLNHLDGRRFASGRFSRLGEHVWTWIVETVAYQFETTSEEVALLETDEGEVVTVAGKPVARIAYQW